MELKLRVNKHNRPEEKLAHKITLTGNPSRNRTLNSRTQVYWISSRDQMDKDKEVL